MSWQVKVLTANPGDQNSHSGRRERLPQVFLSLPYTWCRNYACTHIYTFIYTHTHNEDVIFKVKRIRLQKKIKSKERNKQGSAVYLTCKWNNWWNDIQRQFSFCLKNVCSVCWWNATTQNQTELSQEMHCVKTQAPANPIILLKHKSNGCL